MSRDYRQITWTTEVAEDCRELIRLATREDLDRVFDWTTVSLVGEAAEARTVVRARESGVVAGLPAAQLVVEEFDRRLTWTAEAADGEEVHPGQVLATLAGPARSLLSAERPLLNLLGHIAGIATLTRRFVQAVTGTRARIYDTRKTLPGWRRLDKYAVRCGGGWNHRLGLFDGVLIKDNHLALGASAATGERFTPAEAVVRAKAFLAALPSDSPYRELLVEIEVDSLEQLREVLPAGPDLVLLDNMPPARMAEGVAIRDRLNPAIELEASGGIRLETIRAVAESGVERISVGGLTHSAPWFDVGLDWE